MEKKPEIDLTKSKALVRWIGTDRDNSSLVDDMEALVEALPGLVLLMYDTCDQKDKLRLNKAINSIAYTIDNLQEVIEDLSFK